MSFFLDTLPIPEPIKSFIERTFILGVAPIVTFLGSAYLCWQICQWFTKDGFPLITPNDSIEDITWSCTVIVVLLLMVVAILAQIKNLYALCGATLLTPIMVFYVILTFAAVYSRLGLYDTAHTPDSAHLVVTHDKSISLYFSITTITTVGYGDFTPTPEARWYACYEALSGFALLGVIIATITTALFAHAAMRMKETVNDFVKTFGLTEASPTPNTDEKEKIKQG